MFRSSSNKPLPVTNRACHFWLSVRLLVFHMCSGGSFAASEIIICKDEGLSDEAAGLWQQPFRLLAFSCHSLSLSASIFLSFLSSSLTSHTHFLSSSDNLFTISSIPGSSSLPHHLISLSLTHLSLPLPSYSCVLLFPLQLSSQFRCRCAESQALWSAQRVKNIQICHT